VTGLKSKWIRATVLYGGVREVADRLDVSVACRT
jgi:hypothetical protein